jgi:hypothetical protein
MLNYEQYLLTSLAGQAAQLARTSTKCLSFGSFHKQDGEVTENMANVISGLYDVIVVFNLLIETLEIDISDEAAHAALINKQNAFYDSMRLSTELGLLDPTALPEALSMISPDLDQDAQDNSPENQTGK